MSKRALSRSCSYLLTSGGTQDAYGFFTAPITKTISVFSGSSTDRENLPLTLLTEYCFLHTVW